MSKAMTLPSKNTLLAGLAEVSRTTTDFGDIQFMKFAKTGEFLYGAEDIEVEEGSKWLVNPAMYKGYIAWVDNSPVGEEMAMVGVDQPILKSQLDSSLPWQDQLGIQLICVSGEDAGTACLYKTSSLGGMKALTALSKEIMRKAQAGADDFMPVVTLENDSYKHKKYGKIYTPVFNIIGWSNGDEYADLLEGEVAEEAEVEEAEVEEEQEQKTTTRARTRARA